MTMLHTFLSDRNDFLRFMKSRFHLYHLSNVFFRDVQYGMMAYAEMKGRKVSYGEAESLTRELVLGLTNVEIFKKVSPGTWVLNYPEFRKPSTKIEKPSKPTPATVTSQPVPVVNIPQQ